MVKKRVKFLAASKLLKRIQNNTPELLMIFGVFLVVVSTAHQFLYARSLRLNQELVAQLQQQEVVEMQAATPVKVEIPSVNLSLAIEQVAVEADKWKIPQSAAGHVLQSAYPTFAGNIILFGHNKRNIFGPLRWVQPNQTMTLTLQDGRTRTYTITEVFETEPSDLRVVEPSMNETLTLYTCSGFMDSKRWVVKAVPTEK
jgi:LPXTG-site transpeptidase (sortase) family protein